MPKLMECSAVHFYFIGGGRDVAVASAPSAENINCVEGDEVTF